MLSLPLVQIFLAGAVGAIFLALGVLKYASIGRVLDAPFGIPILALGAFEVAVAFMCIIRPRNAIPWIGSTILSGALMAFALLGPPIRDCFCLGFFASLGPVGRSVVAASLFAASLLGLSLTQPNPTSPRRAE